MQMSTSESPESPSPLEAWRTLRAIVAEMSTYLEASPAEECFGGLHRLVREAMVACWRSGVAPNAFDWYVATRELPRAAAPFFEDWPELESLEVISFRAPTGSLRE